VPDLVRGGATDSAGALHDVHRELDAAAQTGRDGQRVRRPRVRAEAVAEVLQDADELVEIGLR
jgi:hypothetical protein